MRQRPHYVLFMIIIMIFTMVSGTFLHSNAKGDIVSWAEAITGLPTSGTYFGVAFGDVDNDDNLDIVAASDGNGLRVFLGNGAGSWTAVASHPATSGGYGDVALGDYDKDGNLDIFAGSPGNSAGSPTGLHVFKGDGAGGFTEVTASSGLPTSGKWRGVDVGDVNKDGNLDLAATSGYGSSDGIHVYTGDGTGTFTDNSNGLPTSQSRDSNAVLADFNGDSNLDVAAGGGAGVSVYLGDGGSGGSMSWTDSSSGLPSNRFSGVAAADVDNDDSLDIVLSAYDVGSGVGVRVYKNENNAASWTSISSGLPTSGDYIEVSTGDFNDDGNTDIATGGSYGSTYGIHIFYGDGIGAWTENSENLPTGNQYIGNDVGDLNGDGAIDLLFGRYNGGGLEVWKNLGGEPIPPVISTTSPADDATNVALNTGISITFSEAMNRTATEGAISISPDFVWGATWSPGDTSVTLTPSENLDIETEYTITLDTTAVSTDDLNLELSYEFSFTTGSTVDTTPPTVSSTNPASNANSVALDSEITITFSESMDLTLTQTAISISPGSITKRTWGDGGTRVTLSVNLQPETTYTVKISTNARDAAGNNIASDYTFTFTTSSASSESGDKGEESGIETPIIILIVIVIIVVVFLLVYFFAIKK
ncbi:MAG: VCBS repeat-containing protein [Thermoplasmata archaeon]|nr:MAG: VCBS repeat-containing protein [Thermoplasmata archaeon]